MWGFYLYFILKSIYAIFQYIILPILIFIFIMVLVIVIYQHRKYGNSIFYCFKPKDITNTKSQLLFFTLDRIKWFKEIIKPRNLKADYILVDNSGISLFKIFKEQGVFKGDKDAIYLTYILKGKEHRITNPILKLKKDEEVISSILPDVKINKYVITQQGTYFSFGSDCHIVNGSDLYYQITSSNKYTKEEIKEFAQKLKVSNNV